MFPNYTSYIWLVGCLVFVRSWHVHSIFLYSLNIDKIVTQEQDYHWHFFFREIKIQQNISIKSNISLLIQDLWDNVSENLYQVDTKTLEIANTSVIIPCSQRGNLNVNPSSKSYQSLNMTNKTMVGVGLGVTAWIKIYIHHTENIELSPKSRVGSWYSIFWQLITFRNCWRFFLTS